MLIVQGVPLSARKPSGGFPTGIAPFLQLPYFNETVVKKILRKVRRTNYHVRSFFHQKINMMIAFLHLTDLN